ncbi:MAG: HDIG domain-containing protein [Firmicutes bacterium]|nr:HDIG domain-containing protein [Bacillota bacterium]
MKRKSKDSFLQFRKRIQEQSTFKQWLLGGIVFVALAAILVFDALPMGVMVEVGQVARKDLAAPITAVNQRKTEERKEEAARQTLLEVSEDPEYYVLNPTIVLRVEENITGVLNLLRLGVAEEMGEEEGAKEPLTVSEIDRRLIRDWKMELPLSTIEAVVNLTLPEFDQFAQTLTTLVLTTMEEPIHEDDLRDARDDFEASVEDVRLAPALQEAGTIIGRQLIQPNLVLDTEKVNRARQAAVDSVEPVLIMKGEVIVRKGDVVRPEHIELLRDVGLLKTGRDYGAVLGVILLTAILLVLGGTYLYQNRSDVLQNEPLLALVGSVLITMLLLGELFSVISWSGARFLNPSALTGLLLTLLIDSQVATIATIIMAIFLTVINDLSWIIGLLALIGGLTAIFSVSKVSQRGDLMRAGFIVGGVNLVLMLTLGLLSKDTNLIYNSYLGLLSGVLASIMAIGILPYLESIFKVTSSLRLLELSNPNHPLMRRLMLEAPGTYHHSILVGNLAEAAAEAVGADGLLARVGAHYHDIGKLKRPYFFVENQVGIDNPHDKMAPSLSTLIITSHVKDGLELANEFKLPPAVTQFIAQHHGTDLVRYFYHRASEANDEGTVEERDFRYPGPKPHGKEVAIVSLADATEAAVRSISRPNPGKIEAIVRKIIKDRLNSGELDESDLTFQDMDRIANAFVKVIVSMFHARVEYPEQITKEDIEGKRAKDANTDK